MTRCLVLLGTALAIAVSGVGARADSNPVRDELKVRYEALGQAVKNKDVSAVMAQLTPDFTAKNEAGEEMKREAFEVALGERLAGVKSVREISLKIETVAVDGEEAVSDVQLSAVVMVVNADGAEVEVPIRAALRDTWVSTSEGWKLRRLEHRAVPTAVSEPEGECEEECPAPMPEPQADPAVS